MKWPSGPPVPTGTLSNTVGWGSAQKISFINTRMSPLSCRTEIGHEFQTGTKMEWKWELKCQGFGWINLFPHISDF